MGVKCLHMMIIRQEKYMRKNTKKDATKKKKKSNKIKFNRSNKQSPLL